MREAKVAETLAGQREDQPPAAQADLRHGDQRLPRAHPEPDPRGCQAERMGRATTAEVRHCMQLAVRSTSQSVQTLYFNLSLVPLQISILGGNSS